MTGSKRASRRAASSSAVDVRAAVHSGRTLAHRVRKESARPDAQRVQVDAGPGKRSTMRAVQTSGAALQRRERASGRVRGGRRRQLRDPERGSDAVEGQGRGGGEGEVAQRRPPLLGHSRRTDTFQRLSEALTAQQAHDRCVPGLTRAAYPLSVLIAHRRVGDHPQTTQRSAGRSSRSSRASSQTSSKVRTSLLDLALSSPPRRLVADSLLLPSRSHLGRPARHQGRARSAERPGSLSVLAAPSCLSSARAPG